ncbi:c-type cytochrome [Rhizorhabdus wittichii]|uniref:C-type cytochrome n=1 Tax=Rhizorhabdus wittichii TaxID=160791 RepID=A0A975HCC9_9SPHN|nr:c-type cytochrome [Rhizorhabdus wittichii]QTH20112.1 c-type cytochrome [Rhizorhabdus wittichii]
MTSFSAYTPASRIGFDMDLSRHVPKIIACILLAAAGPACASGDAKLGQAQFARCTSCHGISASSPPKIGPRLDGIYGRAAASADPAYDYSEVLRLAKIRWDDTSLDRFLAAPRSFLPGNKMTFTGVADAGVRSNIIAYLKTREQER